MKKMYNNAPLPFQGQKRGSAKQFAEAVKNYPDGTTFVDLFGGSGLLSHIAKFCRPQSRVIYNDYDNYRRRLDNIPNTNRLLRQIRPLTVGLRCKQLIPKEAENAIREILKAEEYKTAYVDYITISANLMFSGNYATSIQGMKGLYNRLRSTDYNTCPDYLEGIETVSCDYKDLATRFRDMPGVVFIVDPPYLSTDCTTYGNSHWSLTDYLDVLKLLENSDFIYFSSNKSGIVELTRWLGSNTPYRNPFARCREARRHASVNRTSRYTDIMLYTVPGNAI